MWSFLGSIPILTILGCQLIEYVGLDESNNNISNKQPITKLGLFLIKNGMYVFNAVFVLVLTCQVGFRTRRLVSSKKSTLGLKLHDSNETSDNTLNTSSSFERKLERNSTVDLFYQTGTEPRGNKPNRAKCACREYRINRSLMGANRSMTLSESFIRLPETPINEHHYCTPNLMAYQSVVCSRTSTTARPQNLGSKFVPFKLNRNDSNLITAKMSRNMSYNAKFI